MSESSNVKAARLRGDKESSEYIAFRDANNAAAARYRERNPERAANTSRNTHLKNTMGISLKIYEELLAAQRGVCAICGNVETALGRGGAIKPLAVDHCHTTGRVRGLLCYACNTMLGFSKDNVTVLQTAINYLHMATTKYSVLTPATRISADEFIAELEIL